MFPQNRPGIEPDTGIFEGVPEGWEAPLRVLYLSYEKSRLNLCKVLD
jgi:rubredoxin